MTDNPLRPTDHADQIADKGRSHDELETAVDRLNQQYADALRDCELFVDVWNDPADPTYRVRIRPADLEDGSWVTDLGPAFQSREALRAYLAGLGQATAIDRNADLKGGR